MPKLKVLSGKDVIKILLYFSFQVERQKGSHVRLKRNLKSVNQYLTIPLHKELDSGTLKAIYRQALRYIPEQELHKHFYSK